MRLALLTVTFSHACSEVRNDGSFSLSPILQPHAQSSTVLLKKGAIGSARMLIELIVHK
jgi:hypothetical protein